MKNPTIGCSLGFTIIRRDRRSDWDDFRQDGFGRDKPEEKDNLQDLA